MPALKRLSAVLIAGVGALLLYIGLTDDHWDPNRYPAFGYKQLTATFTGATLVATPIMYLLWHRYSFVRALLRARQLYVLVIAFGLSLLSDHYISALLPTVSQVGLYAYVVLFCFLLPTRPRFIALGGLCLLWLLLSTVNEHKIALTQLPLTSQDIQIALSNPRGFLNAVGTPPWVAYITLVSAIALSMISLRLLLRTASRWRFVVTTHTWRSATLTA